MKRMKILRGCFAAAAAVALVFGATQAVAAPGAQTARAWCDPYQCATTGCPEGCGPGWCEFGGCSCNC